MLVLDSAGTERTILTHRAVYRTVSPSVADPKEKEEQVSTLKEGTVNMGIVEEIKDKVRQLHKCKDDGDVRRQLSVTENGALTSEQKWLLGALGLFLEAWPDQDTAKSVGVAFGLVEKLCSVKPEESLILNVGCGDSQVQFEMERLSSPVPPGPVPDCMHFCPLPPPGHCCITYSTSFNAMPGSNPGRS